MPEGLTIPVYPFARMDVIKSMLPGIRYYLKKNREVSKKLPQFVQDTPDWCERTKEAINKTTTGEKLLKLWKRELEPYNTEAWWGLIVSGSKAVLALTLKNPAFVYCFIE